MTVSTQSPIGDAQIANGSNRDWSYDFQIAAAGDIALYVTTTEGITSVVTGGMSVSGVGDASGGTVRYPLSPVAALVAGTKVRPVRDMDISQTSSFPNSGGSQPKDYERAIDRAVMMIQQLDRFGTRGSINARPMDDFVDLMLPGVADRAGKFLEFDTDGSVLAYRSVDVLADEIRAEVAGSVVVIPVFSGTEFDTRADFQSATIAAATNMVRVGGYSTLGDCSPMIYQRVGSMPAHQGRIQHSSGVWWELKNMVLEPEMFGAARNGGVDDTNAINATLSVGRPVQLRRGVYLHSNAIVIDQPNAILYGDRLCELVSYHVNNIAMLIKASGARISGFTMRNYHYTANSYAGSQIGIYANETLYNGAPHASAPGVATISARNILTDIQITDMNISNFGFAAIYMQYVWFSKFSGNTIRNCGYAGILTACCSFNQICKNVIEDIGPGSYSAGGTAPYYAAYGITCSRDPARDFNGALGALIPQGNLISENIVNRVRGWNGIDSHGAQETRIIGNRISECYIGIHFEDGDWLSIAGSATYAAIIANNEITGNTGGVTSTVYPGAVFGIGPAINVDGASDIGGGPLQLEIIITGNKIYRAGYDRLGFSSHAGAAGNPGSCGAIRINEVEAITITGNSIDNARRYGIWLGPNTLGAAVVGNSIRGVIAMPSVSSDAYNNQKVGVWVHSSTAAALVDGNIFHGASGMVGISGIGGWSGDYIPTIGTNKKFGAMTLIGTVT